MKKIYMYICLILIFTTLLSVTVSADVPYRSYSRTEWQTAVASPESFAPDKILSEIEGMNEPTDFYIDNNGNIYVLDVSGKIFIFDKEFNLIKKITEYTLDGNVEQIESALGIFADGKGNIYVADTGNERGLKLNESGEISSIYSKPDSSTYTEEVFVPQKILCDDNNLVYILSRDVYQGLVVFSDDGAFKTFYGSPPVQLTINMMIDRMWRMFMSNKQKRSMSQYVPTEFTNIDIDAKGFIYTCSSYTTNDIEQLRQLNYLGKNVFEYQENFGEKDIVYYKRNKISTEFVDVNISSDGILYALDFTNGRVYGFNVDGDMLYTFGTNGELNGAFLRPSAIETFDDFVYVLDSDKASITRFKPTVFGALIKKATTLYLDGQYREALEPWEEIISMDSNYQLAYNGIGEALLKLGDYKGAVKNFRLGYDREKESSAFEKYRSELIRNHIPAVMIIIFIALILLFILTNRKLSKKIFTHFKKQNTEKNKFTPFKVGLGVLRSPVQTYNELKHIRFGSLKSIIIINLSLFVVLIFKRQFSGFRFNMQNPDTLNIFIMLSSTIIPFALFCIANWAICSITEGKGKLYEIATNISFALVPYILFQAAGILLSNVLSLNEQMFLSWFLIIGTAWTAMLIFQAVRITHQFSGKKTIISLLLTVAGMAIILFILALLFILFMQIYSFGVSIYSEIMYRR